MSLQNVNQEFSPSKIQVIVGLGNPGAKYEMTRHNLGSLVVQSFAMSKDLSFKEEKTLFSRACKFAHDGLTIHLVLPTTYMNESGKAVRRYLDYYKLSHDNLLVVVDDIALDFGRIRLRKSGSAGGHNGLKSIEAHLGTQEYARLRMGIGRHEVGSDLADYVLDTFNKEETGALKEILTRGSSMLERLVQEDINKVIQEVNM